MMTARPTRRAFIGAGMAIAGSGAIGLPASGSEPTHSLPLVGVNLASAEFGQVPGRYGHDYMYPSSQEVDYFAGLGFNCLRLPFLWERLQPDLNAAFDSEEKALLERLVADVTRKGLTAVIDPHNYARRRVREDDWSHEHLIGSPTVPTESFLDFWRRLAEMFTDNERVILGLVNEPFDISAAQWLEIANRAIAAIRSSGARNLIAVPGTQFSGAHSWLRSGNTALEGVIDPLNRYVIEVHQYFDHDSSGKSPEAMSGSCGSERLQDFQAWARQKRVKAFLGEFGGADNPASHNALADICQEMSANADVWLGWTAWSAGPLWPNDYIFNLGPDAAGGLRPQTRILAEHARPRTPSYWIKRGAAIDLDLARERYHGCSGPAAVLALAEARTARSGQRGMMRVRGSLLALTQRPDFTLIVETENLATPVEDCDIVAAADGALLRRTASGPLATPLAGGWQTNALQLADWARRRRCAFAVSRSQARVAIGATGSASLWREVTIPNLDSISIDAGPIDGRIVRITGFDTYIDGPALDSLLA
jgi:endoglucanase